MIPFDVGLCPLSSLAAVIALFCRQYDIIKDTDNSNSKEKVKPLSERSTPEHHGGGLLRSKVSNGTHLSPGLRSESVADVSRV